MCALPIRSESQIQRQILDYLTGLGIMHWRSNNIAAPGRKFTGRLGVPDIMVVLNGLIIGIEVKRPGKKQSEHQVKFQADLEQAGGCYILARSVEDVRNGFASLCKV